MGMLVTEGPAEACKTYPPPPPNEQPALLLQGHVGLWWGSQRDSLALKEAPCGERFWRPLGEWGVRLRLPP